MSHDYNSPSEVAAAVPHITVCSSYQANRVEWSRSDVLPSHCWLLAS